METNASSKPPVSVGIIMDGNRRWAREHGKFITDGHRAGLEKIKELLEWARKAGVSEIVLYAFSTENWKRNEEEVTALMKLIDFAFGTWIDEVIEKGIQVRVIGERTRLPKAVQEKIATTEERTAHGTQGKLVLALSYGGRSEILSAVNRLLEKGVEEVSEESFAENLWSAGLADPDLIIRTGGEHRLSNFLPWQSVYSELFFTDTKWPDFSEAEFKTILAEYASRERRRGK